MRSLRFPLILLALVLLAGGGVWFGFFSPRDGASDDTPTWEVKRTPLRVTVIETGSLEALDSHKVVSQVEGQNRILYIVEEGTQITAEDVKEGTVLVRLDSSGLEERLERQNIEVASARAAHENAVANLAIQLQQNASEIRQAELAVRFARLDIERYVGATLAAGLLRFERTLSEEADPQSGTSAVSAPERVRREIIALLEREDLEGESLQRTRGLDSDIRLAEEEFQRATVKLAWTRKLLAKGYVSRDEEDADRIALERRRIDLDQARTARDQFVTYDFPKEVERLLSDVVEAGDQLARTMKRAESSEAKAEADASSRREQEALQAARLTKLNEQLAYCVIRAEKPGLVVYATSGRRGRRDRGERIQEGASVQERQEIIQIPNLANLGVKADIHESVVERVAPGQLVNVIVDAFPDTPFRGVVRTVAPLPNPAESWLNPDRKVYATEITLDEVPPSLKPGMSAKVEILVADLDDVLTVPAQAVAGTADRPTVFILQDRRAEERVVQLGMSNDRFIEIRGGLEPGEIILLAPPRSARLAGRPRDASGSGRGPDTKGAAAGTRPAAGKRAGGGGEGRGARRPSGG